MGADHQQEEGHQRDGGYRPEQRDLLVAELPLDELQGDHDREDDQQEEIERLQLLREEGEDHRHEPQGLLHVEQGRDEVDDQCHQVEEQEGAEVAEDELEASIVLLSLGMVSREGVELLDLE